MNFIQNFIEKNLKKKSLFSYLLYPFSIIYSFVVRFRRYYFNNFYKKFKSEIKVISVGNIVSGGVGKTPFVIFLSEYLRNRGYKVAVSHRGYKGKFEKVVKIISDFDKIFLYAKDAGDEAYLLAQKLKSVPVIVGKNRKLAIKILEKKFPFLDYIILDDSFQHLKVYHDLNFVIFSQETLLGNDFLIPAGILREPIVAVKDADVIVWNGKNEPMKILEKFSKPIIKFHYKINSIIFDKSIKEKDENKLKKSVVVLLSGIGNPNSFEKLVKESKICAKIMHHFAFSDHFKYDEKSLKKLKDYIKKYDISYIITTEKDYVKLQNSNLPLVVISIKPVIENLNILNEILI